MSALLELAGRCERAEGPDRELGREVLRACGWAQAPHGYFLGPLTGWTSPDGAIYFDDDEFVRCKHDPTGFVDAAMTLVPEGFGYGVAEPRNGVCPSGLIFNRTGLHIEVRAATPALALTAAALRARAA